MSLVTSDPSPASDIATLRLSMYRRLWEKAVRSSGNPDTARACRVCWYFNEYKGGYGDCLDGPVSRDTPEDSLKWMFFYGGDVKCAHYTMTDVFSAAEIDRMLFEWSVRRSMSTCEPLVLPVPSMPMDVRIPEGISGTIRNARSGYGLSSDTGLQLKMVARSPLWAVIEVMTPGGEIRYVRVDSTVELAERLTAAICADHTFVDCGGWMLLDRALLWEFDHPSLSDVRAALSKAYQARHPPEPPRPIEPEPTSSFDESSSATPTPSSPVQEALDVVAEGLKRGAAISAVDALEFAIEQTVARLPHPKRPEALSSLSSPPARAALCVFVAAAVRTYSSRGGATNEFAREMQVEVVRRSTVTALNAATKPIRDSVANMAKGLVELVQPSNRPPSRPDTTTRSPKRERASSKRLTEGSTRTQARSSSAVTSVSPGKKDPHHDRRR